MSIEIQDDWLDRKLQEAAPYIEDDGFTARVLRSLPQPVRKAEFLRSFILVAMSALASALTYVRRQWGNTASAVDPTTVKALRASTASRTRPWTDEELGAIIK